MSVHTGRDWAREQQRLADERAAYRRPHDNPNLAALGVVKPAEEEERACAAAEAHMRAEPGRRLPPIQYIWVSDLKYIAGATARDVSSIPAPEVVLLKTNRSYEEIFRTVCHELAHIRDQTRALTIEQREQRAREAAERGWKMCGRWGG